LRTIKALYWQIQGVIFDALVQTRLQNNQGTKTDGIVCIFMDARLEWDGFLGF
jgi:hypothetical protein